MAGGPANALFGSGVLIVAVGLTSLTAMTLMATPRSQQVAVVQLPWQKGGLARAVETGLPIFDVQWHNKPVILSTAQDSDAFARIRQADQVVIDTSTSAFSEMDLTRFDAVPLIAFTITKKTNHGTWKN